ncbi:MAG TPA: hypothetical protein VHL78_10640, partial [Actinomycetota bacterium]|nr:hypothetical protein [Actinomycetota bacterium]
MRRPGPAAREANLNRRDAKEPAIARPFHASTPEEILHGRVADADVLRTLEVLEARGANPDVGAEVRAPRFPPGRPWSVLGGVEEALALLEECDVEVLALPEGSVFYPEEPILQVAGPYRAFARLQTAVLGVLATATAV